VCGCSIVLKERNADSCEFWVTRATLWKHLMEPFDVRAKWFALIGLAAALCAAPAMAQAPPRTIQLDFQADMQADGSLANVVPDAELLPALQQMLRKQVAGWRYTPGTWQGKPVPKRIFQGIVAEVMPAASGGYGLRIKEVKSIPAFDAKGNRTSTSMYPPAYPVDARRQGIEATMIYAIRRDPQGVPIDVELLEARVRANWRKSFDAASRQAIRLWRLEPFEVEGEAIDCLWLTPVEFELRMGPPHPTPAPAPDMSAYASRFPDRCPLAPVLETKVAGVSL
jgi:TonB family protein